MDPGEEGFLALLGEPRQRPVHHDPARALGVQVGHPLAGDVVVVAVETLRQPEAPVQHEGPDERPGAVPGGGELSGERGWTLREALGAVVTHAVPGRQEAREDRRVGGKGERHRRFGHRESHPLRGEPVEVGGLGGAISVRPDVVGSHRVHGHEQEVEVGCRDSRLQSGATNLRRKRNTRQNAPSRPHQRPPRRHLRVDLVLREGSISPCPVKMASCHAGVKQEGGACMLSAGRRAKSRPPNRRR